MIKADNKTIEMTRLLNRIAALPPRDDRFMEHFMKYGTPPLMRVSWDLAAGEIKTEYIDPMTMYQRRCICCGTWENELQHD